MRLSAAAIPLLFLAGSLPARAETMLHLAETATIQAQPDELTASVRAEATSPTARDAQARVNTLTAAAVAQAKQTAGVTVSTGGYNVWHQTTPRDQWQASQTLELRSHDQAALLGLVGALQSKGLAVGDLSWRLSDELARKTRAEALRKAITGLRGRAEEAAGLLGLHFVEFKEVRLDQSNPPPRPMMRMMAAAAPAPHAPPPVAEADKIDVTATVQAEAVLQPN